MTDINIARILQNMIDETEENLTYLKKKVYEGREYLLKPRFADLKEAMNLIEELNKNAEPAPAEQEEELWSMTTQADGHNPDICIYDERGDWVANLCGRGFKKDKAHAELIVKAVNAFRLRPEAAKVVSMAMLVAARNYIPAWVKETDKPDSFLQEIVSKHMPGYTVKE